MSAAASEAMSEIARCIQEQNECLKSGKPVSHPLVQIGLCDWIAEEVLIRLEAMDESHANDLNAVRS